MLPRFDLVVGTEEEFRIAGGRETSSSRSAPSGPDSSSLW